MRISCLLILSLIAVGVAPCAAEEPRVAFKLKDGFVEFALRQDGKPIAATIDVIDEHGKKIAAGETGPEGESAFPLPGGASFTVEIKAEARTADPIRLYRTKNGIEPARVLLSYGLRPCCRGRAKSEPIIAGAPDEPPAQPEERSSAPVWLLAMPIVLLLTAALTLVMRHKQSIPRAAENH